MSILISLLLIFILPLIGVALVGQPITRYLQLPTQMDFLKPASFSWLGFGIVAAFIAATCGPIVYRLIRSRHEVGMRMRRRALPWWGWAGVLWTAIWWVLAWTRFEWFSPLQAHTFTPLWVGYVVIVNAVVYARSGWSMLTHRPRYLLMLFPLSAAFWWSFEYLNRFVQNWHYQGTDGFSAFEYLLLASFSFSTVLPAVLSTRDLLATFPRLRFGTENLWTVDTEHSRWIAYAMLGAAAAAMLLIGILPNYLFPLVWMAPVLIVTAVQRLAGKNTIFSKLKYGNWTPVLFPAIAALVCGLFWEMWNFYSYAHWTYTVPLVHRFQIFEMPLLGYAGYLPFGLECATVAGWMPRGEFVGSNRPAPVPQSSCEHRTSSESIKENGERMATPRAAGREHQAT